MDSCSPVLQADVNIPDGEPDIGAVLLAAVLLCLCPTDSSTEDVQNAIYDRQCRCNADKCKCQLLRFQQLVDA